MISPKANIYRIIDANLNRSKEGLRVCEEVARFILADQTLSALYKKIRHSIDGQAKRLCLPAQLFGQRNSRQDVGRLNSCGELKRNNYQDIFWANIQRVKESLRVLEEFSKIINLSAALGFKKLRFKVYEIEKSSFKKISSLSNS